MENKTEHDPKNGLLGSALMEELAREMGVEFERSDETPDINLIRMQLRLPPQKRTNFLRVTCANGGSAI